MKINLVDYFVKWKLEKGLKPDRISLSGIRRQASAVLHFVGRSQDGNIDGKTGIRRATSFSFPTLL